MAFFWRTHPRQNLLETKHHHYGKQDRSSTIGRCPRQQDTAFHICDILKSAQWFYWKQVETYLLTQRLCNAEPSIFRFGNVLSNNTVSNGPLMEIENFARMYLRYELYWSSIIEPRYVWWYQLSGYHQTSPISLVTERNSYCCYLCNWYECYGGTSQTNMFTLLRMNAANATDDCSVHIVAGLLIWPNTTIIFQHL